MVLSVHDNDMNMCSAGRHIRRRKDTMRVQPKATIELNNKRHQGGATKETIEMNKKNPKGVQQANDKSQKNFEIIIKRHQGGAKKAN